MEEKNVLEIFETKENGLDNIKLKMEFFDVNTKKKLADLNIAKSISSIGVRYELLVPKLIKAQNYKFLSNFKFKDFEFKEIPIHRFEVDNEKYKSEELRSVYIKEGIFYPKNKGTLNIEPVELEMTIDIRTDKKGEYLENDNKSTSIKIASESIEIKWY